MQDYRTKSEREAEDELLRVLVMHFPYLVGALGLSERQWMKRMKRLECRNCEDFKAQVCEGQGLKGHEVVECMAGKTFAEEGYFGECPECPEGPLH